MKYPYKQYKLSTFSIPDSHSTSDIVFVQYAICICVYTDFYFLAFFASADFKTSSTWS